MQSSFSGLEYAAKKKLTRNDRFLADVEAITPWFALEAAIAPCYPKAGRRGRPPIGLPWMLHMYIAQRCFGLSDEGIEDSLYDSQAIRRFVGIDLAREAAPDATTLLTFRRPLETYGLTRRIFDTIKAHLTERGLMLREGTIVDATLIAAPPSTKNREKARAPEMYQSKKGKQWYFGMKAHIGVDSQSGLVHSLVTSSGNASDISQTHALLHGEETDVFADAGYQGVEKRPENSETPVQWHVAMKRCDRKVLPPSALGQMMERFEKLKASIRAKVEHPFHVVKNPLQASQDPLPGSGEERGPVLHALRSGQPGARSSAIVGAPQPSRVLKRQIAGQNPSFRPGARVLAPQFFAMRNLALAALPRRARSAGKIQIISASLGPIR